MTQIKDLRKQLKQINEEKEHTQQEFDNISKQFTQITNEKVKIIKHFQNFYVNFSLLESITR